MMNLKLKCNLCSTPFDLDAEKLSDDMHLHACGKCGTMSYIRRSGDAQSPSLEFFGCGLVGGDLIDKSLAPEFDEQEPVVEKTVVDASVYADSPVMAPRREFAPAAVTRQEPTMIDSPAQHLVMPEVEESLCTQEETIIEAPAPEAMLSWIQEEAESKEEAQLEGTVSEWKVVRANGQAYNFHFLTALRKWIMDGRIDLGDKIQTLGGASYTVENYPGTADLFKNINFMKQRRQQVLADKKKRQTRGDKVTWRHLKKRHFEMFVVASLLCFAFIFSARFAWNAYEYRRSATKGGEYLQGLSRLNMSGPSVKDLPALTALVWSDEETAMQQANSNLTAQVGQNNRDTTKITLLAESFIRRAIISGNLAELGLARNLLDYVKGFDPSSKALLRAEAVYYWSQGLSQQAETRLVEYQQNIADPYGYYIHALLESDREDYQAAKRYLNQASELMPNNTTFLAALAKILEKQHKWNEAVALLSEALDKDPQNTGLLKRLGYCQEKSGNLIEAENIYRRGLQLASHPEEFQYLLVALYNSSSKFEETIKAANHYLGSYPEGTHVRLVQQLSDQAQSTLSQRRAENIKLEERRTGTVGGSHRRLSIRR